MDECRKAREVLQIYQRHAHDESLLKMALEGMIEIEEGCLENVEAESAARHVEACEACTGWLDVFYPDRAEKRQQRELRSVTYCCLSMQFAVTDPESQTRFSFTMFRGEDPCWCVNNDYCFARYCPWCGKTLPGGPFETERTSSR